MLVHGSWSHMPTRCLLRCLVVIMLLATVACSGRFDEPTESPEDRVVRPTAEPTPTPTPAPAVAAGAPFSIDLADVQVLDDDNFAMLSVAPAGVDEGAAQAAAEAAAERLGAYLDAQFTDPDTWFTAAGFDGLLTPRAQALLEDDARRALGDLDLDVRTVETGAVTVEPMVALSEAAVRNVTLTFSASFAATLADDSRVDMRQRGHAVFVQGEGGWQADTVDITLEQDGGP